MALCRTIATLASQLEFQLEGMLENHRSIIAVMKNMPSYLEQGDLSAWETDYRSAIGDEKSSAYLAIDLIYELAGINLFGAYQASETERIYKHAVSELGKLGIKVSDDLDISRW